MGEERGRYRRKYFHSRCERIKKCGTGHDSIYGAECFVDISTASYQAFVLYVGTKKLVKRKAFEEYIEGRVAI